MGGPEAASCTLSSIVCDAVRLDDASIDPSGTAPACTGTSKRPGPMALIMLVGLKRLC